MTEQRKRTVLVVDDYADAVEVWQIFLAASGFHVVTAADGPGALASASAARPDVIVMDLKLPGMSGLEVARRLRSNAQTSKIPLIAATGFSNVAQLQQEQAGEFDEILVKPCDPNTLVSAIRRLAP